MNYTSVYPLNLSRLLSLCGTRVSAEHLQIKKKAKYHHSKAFPSCSLTPQSVTTVLQADQTDKAKNHFSMDTEGSFALLGGCGRVTIEQDPF